MLTCTVENFLWSVNATTTANTFLVSSQRMWNLWHTMSQSELYEVFLATKADQCNTFTVLCKVFSSSSESYMYNLSHIRYICIKAQVGSTYHWWFRNSNFCFITHFSNTCIMTLHVKTECIEITLCPAFPSSDSQQMNSKEDTHYYNVNNIARTTCYNVALKSLVLCTYPHKNTTFFF